MSKSSKLNNLLRYERENRGWSQNRLAEFVGADTSMISRWECGERKPTLYYQEKLCKLFEKNARELGFIEDANSVASTHQIIDAKQLAEIESKDDMKRRQFLSNIGMVGMTLATMPQEFLAPAPWERLSMAVARPSRIDANTLAHLQTITKSYWQLRSSLTSRELFQGVLGHLETVTQLLQSPQPPTIHVQLCAIASEVAQITGQMSFDVNDYATAHGYYKAALEAANEGENKALYAVALGRMSFLHIYTGQSQKALVLLQRAHSIATNQTTATTRSWLAVVEAEAQANLNDATACYKALERAEPHIEQGIPDKDPYWTGYDSSRLSGYKGVCYLKLQKPENALIALQEALALAAPSAMRRHSTILTDLATAYVQQGEVEEGCKRADQALAITTQTKSAMVLHRIQKFRQLLEPWQSLSAVRDLDERLLLF